MVEPKPHGFDPSSVPGREAPRGRLDALRVFRHDCTRRNDPPRQLAMAPRVVTIDAATEHGHRSPSSFERAAMGLAVDAARETADDDYTRPRKLTGERTGYLGAVRRATACADHGDTRGAKGIHLPADEEQWGRIVELCEQGRIARVATGHRKESGHVHDPSSVGDRYDSASATCSAETLPAPASAAIVPATRVTRARPRPERGS